MGGSLGKPPDLPVHRYGYIQQPRCVNDKMQDSAFARNLGARLPGTCAKEAFGTIELVMVNTSIRAKDQRSNTGAEKNI
jgi:hypothetical protein